MRIALISPLFESVPPKLYGGTERVVANLCRGLVELGHEVTLFASGDSQVVCDLVPTTRCALRLASTPINDYMAYHIAQLGAVCRRADEFDVIHNHMDYLGFPLALTASTPVVSTMHGRLDMAETMYVLRHYDDIPLVSISNDQRRPVPELNWVGTVYHGLPLDTFTFSSKPGSYLAFLGRISCEKRPDLAIEIARRSGVPLKFAAKVDKADKDYYEAVIKPQIDGKFIEYIGEIAEHEKSEFLGGALAMLFPIDWPEPFGIAPVEAWACGTPVLARPCGSVPELHVDGVTGYVRDSAADLAALVPRLENFDRAGCRAYAERRFSLHRMCEDYVDVYRKLNALSRPTSQAVQLVQPHDREWGVLHSLGSPAPGNKQDRLKG